MTSHQDLQILSRVPIWVVKDSKGNVLLMWGIGDQDSVLLEPGEVAILKPVDGQTAIAFADLKDMIADTQDSTIEAAFVALMEKERSDGCVC